MLEEILKEQKDVQINSIGRLQDLGIVLNNINPENGEKVEEHSLIDVAKTNLERSRMIHNLIINISEIIKGGK